MDRQASRRRPCEQRGAQRHPQRVDRARLGAVHHSCRGFLDELPGYAWPEETTARCEDKPIKCHDHSCDGLRYVIHSTAHVWRQASDVLKDSG